MNASTPLLLELVFNDSPPPFCHQPALQSPFDSIPRHTHTLSQTYVYDYATFSLFGTFVYSFDITNREACNNALEQASLKAFDTASCFLPHFQQNQ
jgi:hypothetical protein